MTQRIALATCRDFADLDPDDRLLLEPLAARDVAAAPAVWNDPSVDWHGFDAVVLRSTWDYPDAYPAFIEWTSAVPRLINSVEIVHWNTDKRYLLELEQADIPIVPTLFVAPGDAWRVPRDWREIVVKPATSVGSRDTARYDRADPGVQAHLHRLGTQGRTVMLQPYRHDVEHAGETGMIYAGGRFSHAIRKGPLLQPGGLMTDELFAAEDIAPREPDPAELALGERVLALVGARFGVPAYARVDLLPGPMVIEVELTEPSLFLAHGAGSPERLAAAIAAAVSGGR